MNYFILADCNNFYASCERLFNPRLNGVPVIVLSNNDGCVIARSQEAKKLGIRMGQPYFEIKDFCCHYKVAVFSSNYRLYGDLSERVMNILSEAFPDIEIYSIDEAFMECSGDQSFDMMTSQCIALRKKVQKWVGLPISLGIAPTKTLAKVANSLAKKQQIGVFNLCCPILQKEILQNYPVEDVWGIGSQLSMRLKSMSIFTAWDFKEADPLSIRKQMGVVGERMIWELRGVSCLKLEEPKPRKNIAKSRSFGRVITEKEEIAEALATFVSTACEKLRKQKSYANALSVFLEFKDDHFSSIPRHCSMIKAFNFPTNDTPQMIKEAKVLLSKLFMENKRYKKCGVILLDLIPQTMVMPDLFFESSTEKRNILMNTVDALNARFGKNTIVFGPRSKEPKWKMRSERHSKFSTTDWHSLPLVKA